MIRNPSPETQQPRPEHWYNRLYERFGRLGTAALVLSGAAVAGIIAMTQWNAYLSQVSASEGPGLQAAANHHLQHEIIFADTITTAVAIGTAAVAGFCYLRRARRLDNSPEA